MYIKNLKRKSLSSRSGELFLEARETFATRVTGGS